MRNKVQLIGHVGQDPEVKTIENGRKVAKFSLATNENYTNDKGEKSRTNRMASFDCLGETAEIIEKYVTKGKEIAIEGKLTHRSYDDKNGEKKYVTDVIVNELLLIASQFYLTIRQE